MRQVRWGLSAGSKLRINVAAMGVLATCLSSTAMAEGIPCGYEVAHIIQAPYCEPFGHPATWGSAISPNGRYIVGSYYACVVGQEHAFVYDTTTEQFISLPHPLGITSSIAEGVNDAGIICGAAVKSGVGYQGFVYDLNTSVWTPLPSQAVTSGWSWAVSINSVSTVCGFRSLDDGGSLTNPKTAFKWTANGGFVELGLIDRNTTEGYDINEANVVTGRMGIGNGTRPFLWIDGEVINLGSLAEMETVPSALNNLNQVVGRSRVPLKGAPIGTNHAFFWSDGAMIDVGTLPGHNLSSANDISDDGLVLGGSSILGVGGTHRGFLWHGGVIRDINDLVKESPLDRIESCAAISSDGRMISNGETTLTSDFVCIVLVPMLRAPADVSSNCLVDVDDLLLVINQWGETKSVADINKDEIVNYLDLVLVLENWTLK